MKIAVFLPNWVGDSCMATPALRALRLHYGKEANLIGIGRPGPCKVLEGLPWLDTVWTYRPRGRPNLLSRRDVVSSLRQAKVDIAVLLTNSFGTALMAYLGGASQRVGFGSDARRWMLTDSIPVPKENGKKKPIPAVDYYLQVVSKLGCDPSNRQMELAVERRDERLADCVWDEFGWSRERPTIVINSSGAFGASRVWPFDRVVELSRQVVERLDVQVLLHCGPGEREDANRAAIKSDSPSIRSLGQSTTKECVDLPLGLSKAVMQRARVVVSTDSGPRHIAVALNRPVVSLYGSTMPDWTSTYNVPEESIYLGLDCQPCYQRKCPLVHHNCMKNIESERVFKAIQKAWNREEIWEPNDSQDENLKPHRTPLPDVA